MNTATKLGAYALGLAVVFAGAAGVGRLAGPSVAATGDKTADKSAHEANNAGHGGAEKTGGKSESEKAVSEVPGGLQISEDGYQLEPASDTVHPGTPTDFRFVIKGPDGKPVTDFATVHEKKLHFIVAKRDLTGFQHLHPVEGVDGTWSVPLKLADPGTYRIFADFQPAGSDQGLTLGADVFAPGSFRTKEQNPTSTTARVEEYSVELGGKLTPGKASKLTLTVSKNGKPVTDLQPYLGAFGHLVALRDGDLAYLHVHPDESTKPGPSITFYAEVPSPGKYGLYLDFKHEGKVRTAQFIAEAEGASKSGQDDKSTDESHGSEESGEEQGDGHGH